MNLSRRTGSLVPPPAWADANAAASPGLTRGFVVMVTLLGAVLRLYQITGQSLWVDEMLTWQTIRPGIAAGFGEQILDSIQGPLYMAIVWPLVRLQESALMLRLPSALAGIITIPLFGLFVARALGGSAARLATLLLALNPFHVWYSQEGRGYALLILFAVLMGLAYLGLARRDAGYRQAVLFALATAGAVLSNLGGMFLWAAMGLGVLLFRFPTRGRHWLLWGLGFGAGLILVAPWLLKASGIWAIDRIVPGAGTGAALRGETTFSFLAWPYSLQTFFYGYSLGPSLRELHQPDRMAILRGAWPVLAAGAVPVAVGLVAGLTSLGRKRAFLLIWVVVPVLILTVLALRNVKPWNPRYVAMVVPWVLCLAAWGLSRLPRRWGLATTVLLAGLTLWSLGGYYWNGRYAKADVRAAAGFVETNNTDRAPVLAPVVTSVFSFYHRGPEEVIGTFGLPALQDENEADAYVARTLAGRDGCWLVLAREWYFDPGGHLPRALSRSGHLRLRYTAANVRVYQWARHQAGEATP
jgi:4-amino-4-deoxy-L-arabinose transferase-like glycosyltransferase